MKIDFIEIGEEYYFFTQTFHITGFVVRRTENEVYIQNGHFVCPHQEPCAYGDNAVVNLNEIVFCAKT